MLESNRKQCFSQLTAATFLLPVPSATLELFPYAFGLRKQQQIVGSARLRVGAAHVETTKGMRAHHGSRAQLAKNFIRQFILTVSASFVGP